MTLYIYFFLKRKLKIWIWPLTLADTYYCSRAKVLRKWSHRLPTIPIPQPSYYTTTLRHRSSWKALIAQWVVSLRQLMSIWCFFMIHFTNTVKPVLRDHCHERPPVLKDHTFLVEVPNFSVIEPVTKDHLCWERTFLWPMGWSFKTGVTV